MKEKIFKQFVEGAIMMKRNAENLIGVFVCIVGLCVGMFTNNLVVTLGFGLLFIGLNCN